jgi:hypothetical protein
MRSRVVLILTALGLAMVLAGPVAAGGTLDQEVTSSTTDSDQVLFLFPAAQVFTAGKTGQLDQVDLRLNQYNPSGSSDAGGDLTVEIWTVTGGLPATPIPGAIATVLESAIPLAVNTWVQVSISAPSVAGTQYAIVLTAPDSDAACFEGCWRWLNDDSNPYAGGQSYQSVDETASGWTAQAGRDMDFTTYVTAPAATNLPNAAMATPEPSSPATALGFAVLLTGALGILAVVSSRRAVRRR